jgi:hypothetical protein
MSRCARDCAKCGGWGCNPVPTREDGIDFDFDQAMAREEREERRREIADELRGERFDEIAGRSW